MFTLGFRTCNQCTQTKPREAFEIRSDRQGRRRGTCKACRVAAHTESRRHHPEWKRSIRRTTPEKAAGYVRKHKFGITQQRYDDMLNTQGNVCAICKNPCPTGRRLAVDHDHSCCPERSCGNCVRGLLCLPCNTRLGWFESNQETVLTYLSGVINA